MKGTTQMGQKWRLLGQAMDPGMAEETRTGRPAGRDKDPGWTEYAEKTEFSACSPPLGRPRPSVPVINPDSDDRLCR